MPKILIVDDETVFRKGIKAMIGGIDPEWEIVGDAKDGHEALEQLEKLKPDVVLTDIRMPRMDGLQLQRIIRDKFPRLSCVVISGYEDFSYVQQSMRSGAVDYLMKPVEREELARVLTRLKGERVAHETQESWAFAKLEENRTRRQVGEHMAACMLRGTLQQSDFDQLERIGVELAEPYFNALLIKLDKESIGQERYSRSDPSLFQLYIQQFAQEIADHRMRGFSFVYAEMEVAVIVNMADPSAGHGQLLEMAESIRRQIRSLSNLTVTIGVGRPAKGFESLPSAFREAEIALLYRLVVGGDKVLDYGSTVQEYAMKSGVKKWSWEALQQAINEGRTDKISERVDTVVSELCEKARTPEFVHQQICKLLIHYHELSEDLGITKEWLGERDIRSLLQEVCSISSRNELIEACRALLGGLTTAIAANHRPLERDPVALAIQYIDRHYGEPITLQDMADKVFLNPTYFSGLFKQRTGRSFIEHLTEVRLAEAKRRMAMTDEKITGISEQTGFTNIRHFNRVFKNETGLTPKEYRSALRTGKV